MVIENFSHKVMSSGVFHTYIAIGFFATLIFFILNAQLFTPLEMVFGTILVTIALKGMSNIMFSLIILLYDLQNNQEEQEFKLVEDRLDLLMNELKMQEAKVKTTK